MPNCKECGDECEIRASKSDKNPGKQYWSCPNRCKGWIGWIEDSAVKKGSGVKCKECTTECVEKQSFTEKNKGKRFWSCPKRCKVWNGWIEDAPPGAPDNNVAGASNTSSNNSNAASGGVVKRKAPSNGPTIKEPSGEALPKKFLVAYYCVKCDEEIDVDHEIESNLKRFQSSSTANKVMNPVVSASVSDELRESIASGDYTCEACLGYKK